MKGILLLAAISVAVVILSKNKKKVVTCQEPSPVIPAIKNHRLKKNVTKKRRKKRPKKNVTKKRAGYKKLVALMLLPLLLLAANFLYSKRLDNPSERNRYKKEMKKEWGAKWVKNFNQKRALLDAELKTEYDLWDSEERPRKWENAKQLCNQPMRPQHSYQEVWKQFEAFRWGFYLIKNKQDRQANKNRREELLTIIKGDPIFETAVISAATEEEKENLEKNRRQRIKEAKEQLLQLNKEEEEEEKKQRERTEKEEEKNKKEKKKEAPELSLSLFIRDKNNHLLLRKIKIKEVEDKLDTLVVWVLEESLQFPKVICALIVSYAKLYKLWEREKEKKSDGSIASSNLILKKKG